MPLELPRGANIALTTTVLRFTVRGVDACDVSALLTDASLRARSSEDFVFYNQPAATGVRLRPDGSVEVDLAALPGQVGAVLLVASVDHAAPVGAFTAEVGDGQGVPLASMESSFAQHGTAQVCWEVYRRGGAWKARAVGQGYAGGLAALLSQHGVDVDDPVPPPAAPAAPAAQQPLAVFPPLEAGRAMERLRMVFEDAARSCASLLTSSAFADRRKDQEVAAVLADQHGRNSQVGADARDAANRRHSELVATATEHHERDMAHLAQELAALAPVVPVAMADWASPQWAGAGVLGVGDGVRIGVIAPPTGVPLRIPFCLPLPLRRPVWVDAGTAGDAVAVIGALAVRLLADRHGRGRGDLVVDVVDPGGDLAALDAVLAPVCPAGPARSPAEVAARVSAVFDVVDLAEMAHGSGMADLSTGDRLVLVGGFPDSYDTEEKARLLRIAARGPAVGVVLVVASVAAPAEQDDPIAGVLADACQRVPATGENAIVDPWVGNQWAFVADRLPGDPARVAALFAAATT